MITYLWKFGHLMWRADPLEKTWCWERLRAVGEGSNRGWDGWMASPTEWTCLWTNSELVKDREAWWAAVHGVTKNWTQLSDCKWQKQLIRKDCPQPKLSPLRLICITPATLRALPKPSIFTLRTLDWLTGSCSQPFRRESRGCSDNSLGSVC